MLWCGEMRPPQAKAEAAAQEATGCFPAVGQATSSRGAAAELPDAPSPPENRTLRKTSGSRRSAPVLGQAVGLEHPGPAAKPGYDVNTGNIYRVIRGHGVEHAGQTRDHPGGSELYVTERYVIVHNEFARTEPPSRTRETQSSLPSPAGHAPGEPALAVSQKQQVAQLPGSAATRDRSKSRIFLL